MTLKVFPEVVVTFFNSSFTGTRVLSLSKQFKKEIKRVKHFYTLPEVWLIVAVLYQLRVGLIIKRVRCDSLFYMINNEIYQFSPCL
jgi:hypothetical protein